MQTLADALVGTVLPGGYRILQLLGSGGTGHVYAAERAPVKGEGEGEGGRVAVKVLRAEHAVSAELLARFDREAIAASSICHPSVLRVHEIGRLADGLPYFVMELLIGLDLADTLSVAGSLSAPRAISVADGIAAVLEASHLAGIIHRDVRPENIFLVHAADGSEVVKLLDFGLAWMLGDAGPSSLPPALPDARALGSSEYTAPEELAGAPASPAADVYSLGVVLHEMLTGQVLSAPVDSAVPQLVVLSRSIPAALEPILQRALAADPAARFPSMTALRAALGTLSKRF